MREPNHVISTCETETLPQAQTPPAATVEKRKYLLTSGIAKCGLCGEDLQGKPTRNGTAGYACVKASKYQPTLKGCGRIYMKAEPLEEFVTGRVLALMALPGSDSILRACMERSVQTGSALADQIEAINTKLRGYGLALHEGRMSRQAFEAADAAGVAELRALRAEVRRAQLNLDKMPLSTPERLARWWERKSTTMQQKHDLVRLVIEEIRILPTVRKGFRGFQEERVQIVWQPALGGDPWAEVALIDKTADTSS